MPNFDQIVEVCYWKSEDKLKALRQALSECEESGNAGLLDMEAIRLEAKKEAGIISNND